VTPWTCPKRKSIPRPFPGLSDVTREEMLFPPSAEHLDVILLSLGLFVKDDGEPTTTKNPTRPQRPIQSGGYTFDEEDSWPPQSSTADTLNSNTQLTLSPCFFSVTSSEPLETFCDTSLEEDDSSPMITHPSSGSKSGKRVRFTLPESLTIYPSPPSPLWTSPTTPKHVHCATKDEISPPPERTPDDVSERPAPSLQVVEPGLRSLLQSVSRVCGAAVNIRRNRPQYPRH
jgi:hypothetical protein